MYRIAVLASLCCALTVLAEEKKAAAAAAATEPGSKMTCGQMLKEQSEIPASISASAAAAADYFDAHAADMSAVKGKEAKEAKAEASEMKKIAKLHRDASKAMKTLSTEMDKQEKLAGVPDHPAPSEKTKAAMNELLAKQKEMIAILTKWQEKMEKMSSEGGAKAGGEK